MDTTVPVIRVSTVPTFGAYLRFLLLLAFRQVRFLIPFALGLLILFFVFPFMPFIESRGVIATYRDSLPMLILPGIVFVLIPVSNVWAARRRWRDAAELHVPRTYVFSDTGIEVIADTFHSEVAWSHIVIARKSAGQVSLGTAQKLFYLVPVGEFESSQSYDQFRLLVTQKVANSKL
jgi:hypothetical protein